MVYITLQRGDRMSVEKGNKVHLHYTGTFKDGEEFDSSKEKGPIIFEVGKGKVIPGIEEAVVGMEEGEKKEVSLPPEKGYGKRKDDLVREFPRSVLGTSQVSEGQVVQLQTGDNQIVSATIRKLTDEKVTFDFNHPLAGETLLFELELVKIEK